MCSYNAGANLYPNIELLALAAAARAIGHTVAYIDCIAEKLTTPQGIARVLSFGAEILVGICGLECFRDDVEEMKAVKTALPEVLVGLFGYYPTRYPQRCLDEGLNFVLMGEGEPGLQALAAGRLSAPGLSTPGQINPAAPRLTDRQFNDLPCPAHDLVDPTRYSELGLGASLTVAQFTRGCPYPCRYCIRTYGRRTVRRSPRNVLDEFTFIKQQGIAHVRILDDTFLTNRQWATDICTGLIRANLGLTWGALCRADNIATDLLRLMKKAGCKRLFIGIESGSQRILDYYNKGYRVEAIAPQVRKVRRAGIEAVGFFILGAPLETWVDVRQSIALAKRCNLDFVIATKLVIYPGTDLESEIGHLSRVNPWAAEHTFADSCREREIMAWERRFYRAFYTSPAGIRTGIRTLLKDPRRAFQSTLEVLRFAIADKDGDHHPDYL